MSKVDIIRLAKALKRRLKKKNIPTVSYCRRIEQIKTNKRICAMTFDDGPTYDSDITKTIVETLNQFGAKGTFDIIGTTENNYPDFEGKIGTPSWSGTKYDHYPKFNSDKEAGAVNCPDLIDMILSSGHEITNHTYSHILFGKKNIIYSKRNTLNGFDEALDDVKNLHLHMIEKHNYEMKFSRPPHYVDKIKGGFTSYDVYSKLSYNYLAASFDGAGWLPCESEDEEVEAMVAPIKTALEKDPDSLCGQIIFQKDGYNMALRAPVKIGLKKQLEILYSYGYSVVTVSELLDESPFCDIGRNDIDFEIFKQLSKNKAIVYNDNALRPDQPITAGELAMLIAPKEIAIDKRIKYLESTTILPCSIKAKHPYSAATLWAIGNGYIDKAKKIDSYVSAKDLEHCANFLNLEKITSDKISRRDIFKNLKNI